MGGAVTAGARAGGIVPETCTFGRRAVFRRGRHLGGLVGCAENAAASRLLADLDGELAER